MTAACMPYRAAGAELPELEQRLEALRAEMAELEQLVASYRSNEVATPHRTDQRTQAATDDASRSTHPSLHFGGKLGLEYVRTSADQETEHPDPYFKIDELYLYPRYQFTDELVLSADIAVTPDKTYAEEVWIRWLNLRWDTWFEAGLNDPLIANVDRKTEAEILIETAFYRSDELGIRAGGEMGDNAYWWVSATDGFRLQGKPPSEDRSYFLLADGRNTIGAESSLLYGVGLGLRFRLREATDIDFMPFAYRGRLSATDIEFLQAIAGYGTTFADAKHRIGANWRFHHEWLTVIGQWLQAEDGALTRRGWFLQPSIRIAAGWLAAFEWVYRYNDLDIGLPAVFGDSLTWDRKQHVVALIKHFGNGIKLKTEYYFNLERTGGPSVNNDELLIQLEAAF